MNRKVLLQCIVAGLIQILACIVIYIFKIQNPNIVLFVVLSAILVLYGYVAGTVTGIISFVYSAFFFSTDHSFFIYTPVNRDKLIVIALGIVANILIIGALKRANQKAIKNITRLEIEQQKAVEFKKLADKAESANKAKTIFLSNISHDIRTPLNGIIGLISLCKKHVKDEALIKEDLRKMEIASDHLKSLVNDVLELSRIDEGRENIIKKEASLQEIFSDIESIIKKNADDHGIKMQKVGELEYGNTNVMASALHLRQIFLNIYGNCIKFTNRGGSITTSHQCLEKKGNIITFCWTITDTGIGMSKEFLSHIFEPFSQENQGARSQYAGCGLGMAIVKKLIDEMDGSISIDSEIGKGSRFVITLPFEMTSAEVEKEQNQDLTKKLSGVKILLAEDNALNVEVASSMLEDLGANVTAVDNGKKALEEFKNQPAGSFNAILMDLMMPQMDGYAATRAIRGINREDAKEIPIIAVTANAFFEDRQKALDAGMNDHISKPIDVNKMVEVILKHLE